MNIFAIADLHLSHDKQKAMDIFGEQWVNHWGQIKEDWEQNVTEEDIVLIPGDLSWAMHYKEAEEDIREICEQKGKKILIRGNHDFWHGSLSKTRARLFHNTYFLQNDSIQFGEVAFAGTRGWKQKNDTDYTQEDQKIYTREIERLRLSLEAAKKKGGDIIGMMHFPPFLEGLKPTPFTQLFEEYGVKKVVYGHLHGKALCSKGLLGGTLNGVEYILTSCDFLNFKLYRIMEV